MKKLLPLLLLLLAPLLANASASRTIDADALASSSHAFTLTLPAVTGTLMASAGIVQAAPTGSCNGSTTSFTLANTPGAAATLGLYLDGMLLTQGAGKDYTISGTTITLATACATGQLLWAVYSKY